jgi:hypothetical protein
LDGCLRVSVGAALSSISRQRIGWMAMKRNLTVAGIGVLLIALAGWLLLGQRTPKGQAALVTLYPENFGKLEAEFNDAADETRIVALLSPT